MILIQIVHLRGKWCVKCSCIIHVSSWKCLASICPIAGDKSEHSMEVVSVRFPHGKITLFFVSRIVLSPSWLHQWLLIDLSHFHCKRMSQFLNSQRLPWTLVSVASDRQLSQVLQEPCRLKLRIMVETEESKCFNPERTSCRILKTLMRRSCWNQAVLCSKLFYIVQNRHFVSGCALPCRLYLTRNIWPHFEWKCKSKMTLRPSMNATNTICTTHETQNNK